ncbi:T9SS type A sorting domain-containing protein [Hymenobacter ruricola]|uniref:T9SS type A sorting domain-containing protein n=1 Tax=Hymenobacter ruricola TaxID=2791023 RepID=A0ABS0HZU4_9BACT|nr:T9SS type A sorting domain-containing protein [Hymenobacter ruricola]MBF9219872.1 T9SS type A sorting domain-containing protein [Hymenobacter ruricola]
MTKLYSPFRLFGWLLLLGCLSLSAHAQRPPQTWVYDSLGRPLRVNHELLVSFDPSVITRAAVNSRNGNQGPLSDFLKPATAAALQVALGISLINVYAIKVVRTAIPADSLAPDGTHQEPFWNTLLLCFPSETDDYAVMNILWNQPFSVVKSSGYNLAVQLHNSSAAGPPPFLLAPGAGQPLAYPMPAHDVVTFALPSPLPASAALTVFTPAGRVVYTEQHKVFQHGELVPLQINLAALPPGQYFYRLITPASTYQGRFEKQ